MFLRQLLTIYFKIGYKLEPVEALIRICQLGFVTGQPLGPDSPFKLSSFPSLPSLCLFRQFVGLPCIFCGVTRSFILLNQGHWQASLQYHLFGIPFYLSTLFIALLGPVSPQKTEHFLKLCLDKRVLFPLLVLLSACWVWKMLHNPVFW